MSRQLRVQAKRLRDAARDLQEMMEEMEPYLVRPVVEERPYHGRWTKLGLAAKDPAAEAREVEAS